MSDVPDKVDVLIVGGGPCGLMLAIELGRRGIRVLLIDEKSDTAFNPQANATQARTMEHYRRLGFARDIRKLGLPPDHPTDIAYFTRFTGHELSRFSLPSSSESEALIRQLSGSWSAAELPHRVSQKFVERILRREAEQCPSVSVHFGYRLIGFSEAADGVDAKIERVDTRVQSGVRTQYLVGADGPRSTVRKQLGIQYEGDASKNRDFMGGYMLAVYVRAPTFFATVPHAKAWMYCTFNRERRSFMAAVDGVQDFAFHTQLRSGEVEADITAEDAKRMFQQAVGMHIDIEVLSYCFWTAGYALVAERMSQGRVFIGGDAAHLFTPAGGLGYNTAIEDAVNLGWKLAAVLKGQAGSELLESYQLERRPVALRNTQFARAFADSMGNYRAPPEIEEDSEAGRAARKRAGEYFGKHSRAEFNIPGITFGARYDGSPIIVPDGTVPPPHSTDTYVPTAVPGGRPPHLWLKDGQSLYDFFGKDWTLLRLGQNAPDASEFSEAAQSLGIDLAVVEVPDEMVKALYETSLVLIRPDQIVAWRGTDASQALAVLTQVTGSITEEGHTVSAIEGAAENAR